MAQLSLCLGFLLKNEHEPYSKTIVLETLGKGMLQIQSFYWNPLILLFFLREVAPSTWMRKSQIIANWSRLTDW